MKKYKPNLTKLRSHLQQAIHSYKACLQAMQNGDRKRAVSLQLLAIDSLNEFNNVLIEELDRMRTGVKEAPWIP